MPTRRFVPAAALVALLFLLVAGRSALQRAVPPGGGPVVGSPTPAPLSPDGRSPAEIAAGLPAALEEWRALYGPQGVLTEAETLALKARRQAAQEGVEADIGASGPEGARWALASLPAASGSRERLVLLGGLARNPSPEAVEGLRDVYEEEPSVRLREEALRALGRSPGQGATEALLATLEPGAAGDDPDDERLRQVAVQSLAGHAAAIVPLHALARDRDAPLNVRLEAIPSLGAVGSPEAREALTGLAQDPALEPRIRQYAARALERSGA